MQHPFSVYKRRRSLVAQVKTRLVFSIGLLLVVLIIHLTASILSSVMQYNVSMQSLTLRDDINELQNSLLDQESGIRDYIVTANPVFLEPFNLGHETYISTLHHLQRLLDIYAFDNTRVTLPEVEALSIAWYQDYAQVQLANMQNGRRVLAQESTAKQGKQLFDHFRLLAFRLQNASKRDVEQQQQRMDIFNVVATVISLLLSLLVFIILWRMFTHFAGTLHKQLAIFEDTSKRLGEGNFAIRVPALESPQLHHMGKTFNAMAEALQMQSIALKDRDVLESVLQLNTLLTSTLDFDTLIRIFLNKAFSLLHLQLAALYLYDLPKERLILADAAGFDFAELTTEFVPGEDIAASATLKRSSFYVQSPVQSEVSNFITRPMPGKALPASLYQLPLIQGNALLGILVFGSLYPMSEQTCNILTVVAGNFSTAISHTKAFEHVQVQAEELATRNREQEQMNVALRIQRNELRILNTMLGEANEVRNHFVSTLTHEIRTPLTAMLGFSQIVLRDLECRHSDDQRSQDNIERIIKNGNHLLALVNDTLDLVKIEAGHMSVSMSTVHLPTLITDVVEEIRLLLGGKKLALYTHIAEGVDEIESDPGKLRQILLNLISNAIKFTEQGGVRISVTTSMEGEDECIAISVEDTGIGIAAEMQERIFDAFYQGDSNITRKYGGTGLGLSIVRQLTLLLGGTLLLKSSLGQGSTFTISLPQISKLQYEEYDNGYVLLTSESSRKRALQPGDMQENENTAYWS